jgi:ABC-type molybdate transport system substrate-binding protein
VKPALALLAALTTAACKRTPPPSETALVVLADETLRDAFNTMLADFNWAHRKVEVTFTFGTPGEVIEQVKRGAATDVVALCGQPDLDLLERTDKVGTPVPFARDELVAVGRVDDVKRELAVRRVAQMRTHGHADDSAVKDLLSGQSQGQIVSRTALRPLGGSQKITPLPADPLTLATCSVAPSLKPAHPQGARDWVAFVRSSIAQQTVLDAGLQPL